MLAVGQRIELAEKVDRVEILTAAELIRHPLSLVPRVVEIQHRRHRIHPNAVHVVFLQPEQRVGEQEISHLVAPVVEDQRAPLAVFSLTRILVLEERRAVELGEPVRVFREMAGHPVENDPDIVPVTLVDKGLEVVRAAEPAGRRVETNHLIAPRSGVRGVP